MTARLAHHRQCHRRRRAGFTLLDTMHAIALLAVFMLLASQLFTQTWRILQQTDTEQQRFFLAGEVVQRLRRDVWQADRFDVPGPGRAVLHHGDQRITWHTDDAGLLHRTVETMEPGEASESAVNTASHQTFALGAALAFQVQGPALRVEDGRHELLMVNHQRLWQAAHPQ